MNFYDEAHSLARAIKESQEFKQYMAMKEQIAGNEELNRMLADFQAQQMQLQARQMMGEELGPEMMQSVQELTGIMMRDPLAANYLQCEMRFSMMMSDVYKILGEAMGIVLPGTNNG